MCDVMVDTRKIFRGPYSFENLTASPGSLMLFEKEGFVHKRRRPVARRRSERRVVNSPPDHFLVTLGLNTK